MMDKHFLKKDLKHGYKIRLYGWEGRDFNSFDGKPTTHTYLSPLKLFRLSTDLSSSSWDIRLDTYDDELHPIKNPYGEISEVWDKQDNLIYQNEEFLRKEMREYAAYLRYAKKHENDTYDFVENIGNG